MAETEQNFVENNEEQNFSLQESDQHQLAGDEGQQNIANMHDEYNFVANESENQGLVGHEHSFAVEEVDNDFVMISEQNYTEEPNEQTFDEDQGNQGLEGDELKQEFAEQEFTENEANEMDNPPDDLPVDKKDEHENNVAGVIGEEKKWPGWPGESVFRMLVPAQKVGNIIGRKGEYIKKIVEETRARIKILDGPPGSQERAVMVSAKEEPDNSLPPAMAGLLKVHSRIVDGLDSDSSQAPASGNKVSTKLLVPATQAGSLIGKQGATVKSIQEGSSCIVRVLGQEDLPVFALQDDRVVEVVGEPVDVHKAIELIGTHLRKFLVDRSIIPLFEKQMQAPSAPMEHMPPQPWGPPHGMPPSGGPGHGYGHGPQYMPPPPRHDNYYSPADMAPPPDRQPHQGISAYGREPPMNVHASSNAQAAPSMITQITQHMQVPLMYADAVIGANGATISYIRRASGATVTIQETRGVPGEMTVEINGTASQVQAAQQLVQNYMADAAAAQAAPAPTQTGAATEQGYSQGYNSYAAPASVYGSVPSSAGHAGQPGAYGSMYGGNYGY